MKKACILIASICIAATCMAQTNSWKECNDFHKLVSKVLHPVMVGNINPVKDSSYILLAKAKAWQASAIPKNINATTFKTQVANLVVTCTELDNAVKEKKPDNELKALAVKTHDTFHALLSACNIKD